MAVTQINPYIIDPVSGMSAIQKEKSKLKPPISKNLQSKKDLNGWKTGKSPITGEKWIMKELINESGSGMSLYFKLWKNGDSYYWTICDIQGSYFNSLSYKSNSNLEIKVGEEWMYFWNGRYKWSISKENSILMDKSIEHLKSGTIMKLENVDYSETVYLQLEGSTAAMKLL